MKDYTRTDKSTSVKSLQVFFYLKERFIVTRQGLEKAGDKVSKKLGKKKKKKKEKK